MSLQVNVREAKIDTKNGVSRKTGKPYSIHEQPAYVTLPNGETEGRQGFVRNTAESALSF